MSDPLTGRCETFDRDGCRRDSHRAKIHDPDDQEDRHRTGTALAAVEAEAEAVSPGRAGICRQRMAAPGPAGQEAAWEVSPQLAVTPARAEADDSRHQAS